MRGSLLPLVYRCKGMTSDLQGSSTDRPPRGSTRARQPNPLAHCRRRARVDSADVVASQAGGDLRSQATALADTFGARALATEQLGRLPDETLSQLLDIGIARVLVPRQWGGLELEFSEVIDVLTTIAQACMSTAWCAALYAEHPWVLAHFDERAQTDVWSR